MTRHTVIMRIRKISILEVPDLAIKNIVEIDILNMVIQAKVKMIIEDLLIPIYLLPIQKKLVAATQVAMGILHRRIPNLVIRHEIHHHRHLMDTILYQEAIVKDHILCSTCPVRLEMIGDTRSIIIHHHRITP